MSKRIVVSSVIAVLGAAVLWAGCSGDVTTVQSADAGAADAASSDGAKLDSATADGAADTATNTDSATPTDGPSGGDGAPVNCGGQTCTGANVCCLGIGDAGPVATCAPSCPDGGAPVACDGPAQCTSASPLCCAHIAIGAGSPPACPFNSISSACQATCATSLSFTCPATETVRLCGANADCASDTQNPNCCKFTQGAQTVTFCVNDFIKSSGAGQCL